MKKGYDYGMVGLGTMGGNLALNMNDNGFSVCGYDKDEKKVTGFLEHGDAENIYATADIKTFTDSLQSPKVIILLVPAGKIVDAVISDLLPFLMEGDIIIDGGNSHFTDTQKRILDLADKKIDFMGVGISGGEHGARFGPSIMPGGSVDAYSIVEKMLVAISAKVDDVPCVAYMGKGAAGHYVKMVHNGIEYGMMQLIAETYQLLKVNLELDNDAMHKIFAQWNKGILKSYLIAITANIFVQKDDLSDKQLIDVIKDTAQQKGTGGWTSLEALELRVPIPVIDLAVAMRDMSAYENIRSEAHQLLKGPTIEIFQNTQGFIDSLERALYFSFISTYAQGFALLSAASEQYQFNLNLKNIATIWRGGCIIRSAILEDIRFAFSENDKLSSLLLNKEIAKKLIENQDSARSAVISGVKNGLPIAGLMSALLYFDAFRNIAIPANLIQAQRDFFGAHTYERIDKEGKFHTNWNQIN